MFIGFNTNIGDENSLSAQDSMATRIIQVVIGSIRIAGHTLDLMFQLRLEVA